jgi:hypothetical protein
MALNPSVTPGVDQPVILVRLFRGKPSAPLLSLPGHEHRVVSADSDTVRSPA